MELTAPQDVTVVAVANSVGVGDAEADFLALHVAAGLRAVGGCRARAASCRVALPLGRRSTEQQAEEDDDIAASTAQPCRVSPTILPKV